jgi:hypothetical protein
MKIFSKPNNTNPFGFIENGGSYAKIHGVADLRQHKTGRRCRSALPGGK